MKCQRCSGNGKYKTIFGNTVICDFCYGTGEIAYGDDDRIEPIGNKKPMTNEEWFCGLSTEEKAIWIERIMFIVRYRKEVEDGAYMQTITKKDYIENWLKEIHE